jgi:hypothetical protein
VLLWLADVRRAIFPACHNYADEISSITDVNPQKRPCGNSLLGHAPDGVITYAKARRQIEKFILSSFRLAAFPTSQADKRPRNALNQLTNEIAFILFTTSKLLREHARITHVYGVIEVDVVCLRPR